MAESLLVEPVAAVDTDLWLPFSALEGRGSVSSRLLPTNERLELEKEAFFASGGASSPNLTVRGITDEQLEAEELALLGFKDKAKQYEGEGFIGRIYRTRVNEDIATADVKARSRSWGLLESAYKGTFGHSAYYGQYGIYLEGNIACWNNPDMIMQGDKGKFDINNNTHTQPLRDLGIITV